MVNSNILQRTFHLRFGGGTGTGFTVDLDGRHYLVTAAHVVEGIRELDVIWVNREQAWQEVPVRLVGRSIANGDIAVLAPDDLLSPLHPLRLGAQGIHLAQNVWFLGFPYGIQMDMPLALNRGFPLPLVKKAIISAFLTLQGGRVLSFLMDGHNNPGFSGGPVIFPSGGPSDPPQVCAVISGYRQEHEPVLMDGQPTPLTWADNTGIIVATEMSAAVELIRANPVGIEVPSPPQPV